MGMDAFKPVTDALHSLGDLASAQAAVALLLTGTLTMAVIQIIKDMTTIRRAFQRNWIRWWLRTHAECLYENGDKQRQPIAGTIDTYLVRRIVIDV